MFKGLPNDQQPHQRLGEAMEVVTKNMEKMEAASPERRDSTGRSARQARVAVSDASPTASASGAVST